MDALRAWTLSVCLACVAAGILQHLAAGKGREPVIKLVLSLYILVTALAPLRQWRAILPELDLQGDTLPAAASIDTRRLALDSAEESLARSLEQALAGAGLDCGVRVELQVSDDRAEIARVTLYGDADREAAQQAVWQALGAQAPICWEDGGGGRQDG